jgi:hypothetical protein
MHNGSRNNSCYFIAWDFKLLYYTKRKDKFLHMCCKKRSLWRIISKKLHTAHNERRNNSCYFIAWDFKKFKLLYYTKKRNVACDLKSHTKVACDLTEIFHSAHNESRNNSCYFIAWDFKLLYYTKKRKVACDLKSESNAKVAVTWLKFCIPRITRTEITLVILLRGTSSPTQLHEKKKSCVWLEVPSQI